MDWFWFLRFRNLPSLLSAADSSPKPAEWKDRRRYCKSFLKGAFTLNGFCKWVSHRTEVQVVSSPLLGEFVIWIPLKHSAYLHKFLNGLEAGGGGSIIEIALTQSILLSSNPTSHHEPQNPVTILLKLKGWELAQTSSSQPIKNTGFLQI